MSEHTKGEMLAKPDLGNHKRWHLFIGGISIAKTSNWLDTDSQEEEIANAKRIALAWNCHDELVEALEDISTLPDSYPIAAIKGKADVILAKVKAKGEA